MAKKGGRRNDQGDIIIRKEEVVEGGHHGGAWKVAYADFVTAMMAFFLLMWLLNATTEEQRRGLADYFAPLNVLSRNSSGLRRPVRRPHALRPGVDGLRPRGADGDRGQVPGGARRQPGFQADHPGVDHRP